MVPSDPVALCSRETGPILPIHVLGPSPAPEGVRGPPSRLRNPYRAQAVRLDMRYLVRGIVPADVGNRLDASGGPGKVVGHIMTRFNPECAYSNYEKREVILVVDFETPAKQAEFMILWSRWFGNYTEMTPVHPMAETPKVAQEAIAQASKAPK